MADLKLIGAVAVKVRPDAKGFRGDAKRQILKELAGQEYEVVVDLDLDATGVREKAKRAVRDVREEVDKTLNVKVGVDPDALRKASSDIGRMLKDFKVSDVKVNMDQDYLRRAGAKLNAALNAASAAGINVDVNTSDGLEKAKRDIDEFLKKEDGKGVKFKSDMTGLEVAAAQLKYATRDRKVNFFVDVNKKSLIVAEGLIKSLAGLGVLTSVGRNLESLIVNFDKFSLKSAGWATAIGNVVNALAFIGTSAFTVGEGMVQSIGLLATLPTALAAVASAVTINVAAFKNFKSAIDGDADALAALPDEARAAAIALRGTWDSIQKPVQKAFWVGMGESIQRFAANVIPVLRDGLTGAADDVGRFNAGILDSFEEIAKNGDMKKMFGNLEGFFRQASAASKPFFDALNTLGLRGSDYLPRFGGFLADIAQGFDDWITKADEAGKINVWIEKGVQSLKDMGSVGKSVVDMFKGITRAVNDAGGGGLPEFRDNMRDIADVMLAEPFRSRMATIFAGARQGATELNKGVKDLGETIGNSAGYVNELLKGLGKLGGGLLSGIAKTLGQLQFQTGTLEGIRDMQSALADLGPSFEGLGRIIGNMSRVAGEIFKGVAPVINTIVGFLDRSVGKLSGNLEKFAPSITGLVNALVTAASGPLAVVVDLLDASLGAFNDLPGPIKLATGAFAVFLALRGPLGSFLGTVQSGWSKFADSARVGAKSAETSTKRIGDFIYAADGSVRKFDGSPMVKQLQTIGDKAAAVGKRIGSSLLSFAGGPWGVALAVAGTAIAMVGDAAAKQKAKVDDLVTALDGQKGINAAAERVIASQLRTKEAFLFWEKDSIATNAQNIGISLRDLQKAAEGVPESIEAVNAAIKKAADSATPLQKTVDVIKALGDNEALGPLTGLSQILGNLFGSDAAKTGAGLQKIRADLEAARKEVEETAKQLGVPTDTSAGIIAAIEVLAEKSSTAEDKLRAVNDVIRMMNGKTSVDDAIQKSNDSARDFVANLQEIVRIGEGEGLALPALFNADGTINTVSKSGSDLRTELRKIADDGRNSALALALAQKDPQVAIDTLRTEMQKTRDLIAQQLTIGGVPPEQIDAILAQLDLDPAKIDMTLNPESKDKALADLKAANGEAQATVAEPATIGLDVDASSKFAPKLNQAQYEIGAFNNLKPTPQLDADPSRFNGVIAQAKGQGAGLDATTFRPDLDANKSPFDTAISTVRSAGNVLSSSTFSPTVNVVGNALSVLGSVIGGLQSIAGKVFTATVDIAKNILGGAGEDGMVYEGLGKFSKKFQPKFFADGGLQFETPGQAKIYPGSSTWRVFAEETTGGEAYIPLSASKRARSTAILDDVAGRFGYELYERGGTRGGSTAGSSTSGDGLHIHVDAAPGVAYLYAAEVGQAAATRARDMQTVYDVA
ncbi:hypothetical protein CQ020_03795 [Arthrobacter sp. MYb23]|uniref:hypothetical protein n=1 Tax=unclassified Arthrobacter TaxID=235627 RepID=UPI000CFB0AE9|nr:MULTISPECIES: hypothetical protein [unclassified Arthrobacter]PRB44342.1 hypothetical protein CQ038_03650 [Arthrobacter sp. MYb51]PRB98594.1 hypothetical protein CQ020_03795 [Arthrobacter sp. MYb23]